MKKILLTTVALAAIGTATSASAADLAARPYTKAPPMIAAVYDWSGFYIGGNGGYGTARRCWDFIPSTAAGVPTGAPNVSEGCHDADGGTAGGQIGYRWQSASWVYGLEAQGNWADFKGSNVSTSTVIPVPGAAGLAVTNRSKIDAFGLFTGQIGYAWNNTLLYAKGGAAVVSDKYSSVLTGTGVVVGTSDSDSRWGGVVGVGLEYGFTPNWSFAVEYDHIFLENRNARFTNPAGGFFANERISGDVDIVTARVNYRWGGPAVARY